MDFVRIVFIAKKKNINIAGALARLVGILWLFKS